MSKENVVVTQKSRRCKVRQNCNNFSFCIIVLSCKGCVYEKLL